MTPATRCRSRRCCEHTLCDGSITDPLAQRNQFEADSKRLYELTDQAPGLVSDRFKPDDHSELVPLLPIPNRTVKRLSADDSADSRVKVGHRQATYSEEKPLLRQGLLLLK